VTPVGGAGCGARGSGLVSRAPGRCRGRPEALRPPATGSLTDGGGARARHVSSRRRKARPRTTDKRRGEAPKGAPARVKSRRSPAIRGPARPQGGPRGAAFRTGASRRFTPSVCSGGPGLTATGRRKKPRRISRACNPLNTGGRDLPKPCHTLRSFPRKRESRRHSEMEVKAGLVALGPRLRGDERRGLRPRVRRLPHRHRPL
jgi:hypothetical protein